MSKREGAPCLLTLYKRSSIGRAAVSKTAGRGFDSYRLCNVSVPWSGVQGCPLIYPLPLNIYKNVVVAQRQSTSPPRRR